MAQPQYQIVKVNAGNIWQAFEVQRAVKRGKHPAGQVLSRHTDEDDAKDAVIRYVEDDQWNAANRD
jgi:hypothetical protein